ncbi:MAG TPA: DUF6510 family protein [Solirubrobacteraceae bacterium]
MTGYLDGNALAGLLMEAFGADQTAAPRGCVSCGTVSAVGAYRLYVSAGYVLRCPVCGDVNARVAHDLRVTASWTS